MDAKRVTPPPTLYALLAVCLAAVGQGYQLPSDELWLTSSPLLSDYRRQYDALATVMRQDHLWRNVGNQQVYFKFDRRFYSHIIDNELLQDMRPNVKSGGNNESTGSPLPGKPDTVDQTSDIVKPLAFLRNLFVSRYRIGSLLDAGMQVLRTAFRCLAYKHTSFMLLTIKEETLPTSGRSSKAPKRSARAAQSVYWIAAKMASALQFVDGRLSRAYSLFRSYSNKESRTPAGTTAGQNGPDSYALVNAMDLLSTDMMRFVAAKCVKQSITEKQVVRELKLVNVKRIQDQNAQKANQLVKEAFNQNWATVDEQFPMPPSPTIDGDPQVTKNMWNELLQYDPRATWIVSAESLY